MARPDRNEPEPSRRRLLGAAAAGGLLATLPQRSRAWQPERAITLYTALPAGGIQDQQMRFLGERVQKILGQPVVVDAKPGAGATLAPTLLLNARPDGHTLAANTVNSFRYPHYQKTNYDPLKDFSFVIGLANFSFAIAVRADSPFRTIEELIDFAKKNPGKLTSGSTGQGGTGHLILIDIEQATGAQITQVTYKGGPDAIQALLGGHIDMITDGTSFVPLVEQGKLRMLALATEAPVPRFKDVPTLREKGIDAVGWSPYGILGPKGMPEPVVKALHDAFKQAMDDPGHQALLDKFIMPSWYQSPAAFRAWAESYYGSIRPKLVKAGLTP